MDIKGFSFVCGGVNVPGIVYQMYFASKCDIDTYPGLKPIGAVGDSITLDGNIVLKPGKTWKVVTIISNTGKISHQGEGARSAKGFSNLLDFKMAKDIGSDEWFNHMINFEGCVLIREKVGRYRAFGTLDDPAHFETATGDGGAAAADESAWTAQIKDDTGRVCPIYEGTISLVVENNILFSNGEDALFSNSQTILYS